MPQNTATPLCDDKILSGVPLRENLLNQVKNEAQALKDKNINVLVVSVLAGHNPASVVYTNAKEKAATSCGINFKRVLLDAPDQHTLEATLRTLDADPEVTGILLQAPLPHGLDFRQALETISPQKDIDGLTTLNTGRTEIADPRALVPCTPLGVMRLLAATRMNLKGVNACVVGRSHLVGRPLASLLGQAGATVTVCHRLTHDLKSHTQTADLLVVAAGHKNLITADHIKPGAVVIDVGINDAGLSPTGRRRICGDTAFAACQAVAGRITPVPGGVGPMTVASLMTNAIDAACLQNNLPRPHWAVQP